MTVQVDSNANKTIARRYIEELWSQGNLEIAVLGMGVFGFGRILQIHGVDFSVASDAGTE